MVISDLNYLETMSDKSLVEGGFLFKNTNQTFVNYQRNYSDIDQKAYQKGFFNGKIYQNADVEQSNYNFTYADA